MHDCALFLINYYIFMTFSDHFILNEKNRMESYNLFYGSIYLGREIPAHPAARRQGRGRTLSSFCTTMTNDDDHGDLFYYLWCTASHTVFIFSGSSIRSIIRLK